MEAYIDSDKLEQELTRVAGAIDRKSPIPILENVLVRPQGMEIKISATNLEMGIHTLCVVDQMAGTDSLCINARQFLDIVRLMPSGLIKIASDAQRVKITAQGSNFKIQCADATVFPEFPEAGEDAEWVGVPAKEFKALLRGVQFAISTSEHTNYSITGIKVEIADVGMKAIATDGRRLSMATCPMNALLLNDLEVLIPRNAVTELLKFLADFDDIVDLCVVSGKLFARAAKRVFFTRLMAGVFPMYKDAFKLVNPFATTFSTPVLSQSIKRVMVVSDPREHFCIIFKFADKKLSLSANTSEGECHEVLESDFNGPDMELACSGRYLMDFLSDVGEERVTIGIKDDRSPLFLRAVSGPITYDYVLSPMRSTKD